MRYTEEVTGALRKERRMRRQHTADLDRIVVDPAILVGKPVVRGTRIPVSLIINFLATGHTPEEIIDAYPVLAPDDIEAALAYANREQVRTEVRGW